MQVLIACAMSDSSNIKWYFLFMSHVIGWIDVTGPSVMCQLILSLIWMSLHNQVLLSQSGS